MPCLNISTNVNLEGVDMEPIYSATTLALSSIIGRPSHLVMVLIKGSVGISFSGSKEPAAFAQLISMGGINSEVKKKLITSIGAILESYLSIPPSRFFCHVIDTRAGRIHPSKL